MKSLTIADLVKPKGRKPAQVKTPEIEPGSICWILAPTADQRDQFEIQWGSYLESQGGSAKGFRKFMVAYCLADAENCQLMDPGDDVEFSDEFVGFAESLNESVPIKSLARLFDVAMNKMGMTKSDVEELEKNCETIHSDDGNGSTPSTTE